jgi:mono/diheme cytochrome c family protein
MRRVVRVVGRVLLALVGLVAVALAVFWFKFPAQISARTTSVEVSADKLARGTYLAEHVAVCVDCHSERDFSRFSGPAVPGTIGQGGQRFGHDIGLPGEVFAPNITPERLSSWSDGEIERALTSGLTPEGRALFPIMNYPAYAKLCRRDVDALITYVRGMAPIAHDTPASSLDFPVNLIVRTMPQAAQIAETCPDPKDTIAHGRYLTNVAGCIDCHTQRKGPDLIPELAFGGGVKMPLPTGGFVTSKNITPDATGIGGWSRETFVNRFAAYRDAKAVHQVEPDGFNSLMPWSMYAGMSDEDLAAIYDYLRTVAPVRSETNAVAAR